MHYHPVAKYGLSDNTYESLMDFQIHTGRIFKDYSQGLCKVSRCCSLFGLDGLETLPISQLRNFFLYSIKNWKYYWEGFLCKRVETYIYNTELVESHKWRSPTFEILQSAKRYGLYNVMCDMVTGTNSIAPPRKRKVVVENSLGKSMAPGRCVLGFYMYNS